MRLNLPLGRKRVAGTGFDLGAEKSRVAEALVRSASRILESRDDRDIIHSVCEALTLATPHVRLAWTWFGPLDTPRIVPQVVVGPAADYARKLSIDRSFFTEIGSAFRSLVGRKAEPFNVSRMSLYGPWREAAATHGIRSSLALPLASTVNEDRGLLALYADQPDYFEQVGIGLFESLAHMFSAVLSRSADRARPRELAHSDALTGLFSRHAIDAVARPILRTDPLDPKAAALLIDIDQFSRINDEYGPACGDTLLCSLADRLRRGLRKGDDVFRWEGAQFLVFCRAPTWPRPRWSPTSCWTPSRSLPTRWPTAAACRSRCRSGWPNSASMRRSPVLSCVPTQRCGKPSGKGAVGSARPPRWWWVAAHPRSMPATRRGAG